MNELCNQVPHRDAIARQYNVRKFIHVFSPLSPFSNELFSLSQYLYNKLFLGKFVNSAQRLSYINIQAAQTPWKKEITSPSVSPKL